VSELNSALHTSQALANTATPLSPELPLPHRRVIRSWLTPMTEGQTLQAIALLVLDSVLWLACIAATVYFENILVKLVFGIIAGFVTGRITTDKPI